MIAVICVLLAFGTSDIVRASKAGQATVIASLAIAVLSALCAHWLGLTAWRPIALGASLFVSLVVWLIPKREMTCEAMGVHIGPGIQLAVLCGLVAVSLGLAGQIPNVGGPFSRWFNHLPLPGVHQATATQAALAIAAAVFLLHTTNRVIRLVLVVVGAEAEKGENKLKGGRYIGPIERLIVAALMLAGSLEGAGLIIAAKGFIRLPEIRSGIDQGDGEADVVAEYFLIGTLTSILIAGALAALILAAP